MAMIAVSGVSIVSVDLETNVLQQKQEQKESV